MLGPPSSIALLTTDPELKPKLILLLNPVSIAPLRSIDINDHLPLLLCENDPYTNILLVEYVPVSHNNIPLTLNTVFSVIAERLVLKVVFNVPSGLILHTLNTVLSDPVLIGCSL